MEQHKDLQGCIEACEEALHQCQHCAGHDIREGNMVECALICLDCADACAATLKAMARGSMHHGDFCALCAHLCEECAAECEKHADHHEHCRKCAEACRKCAEECKQHAPEKDA